MSLTKKLKSHLSTFFASTAACSLLFAAPTASADTPQDVSLSLGTDSVEAARTDLRSRADDTRIVTQAATTTVESRLVSRRAEGESTAEPVRRRPLSRIMHRLETMQNDGGGTLLFSDSPEYATEDGILYRDTVQGTARVLYYHVNRMDAPKKVAIVLENRSNGTSMVTVSRGGASQPSPHYLDVGKATQALYFDAQQPQRFFLKKGERRVLVQDMDTTVLQPEDLVYGCYDFTTTQAVRTSVVICPADADPAVFVRHARVLPADDLRLRGTFAKADRTIRATHTYDPEKDGIAYFLLADNESDLYRKGIDATDGSETLNYGNYGILYKDQRQWIIRIKNTSAALVLLALLFIWAPQLHTFAISIAAFAVALVIATKEMIMCFMGAIMRASSQPFNVGEWVTVDGVTGEVVD